jgi:hypothetical protein
MGTGPYVPRFRVLAAAPNTATLPDRTDTGSDTLTLLAVVFVRSTPGEGSVTARVVLGAPLARALDLATTTTGE